VALGVWIVVLCALALTAFLLWGLNTGPRLWQFLAVAAVLILLVYAAVRTGVLTGL
jgi:hypothetical protein